MIHAICCIEKRCDKRKHARGASGSKKHRIQYNQAIARGRFGMRTLLSEDVIRGRIEEIAREIAGDYAGKEPHVVGVLKGACPFMMDLVRSIDLPLSLDYIAVSSYGATTKSTGEVRLIKDLDQSLDGRDLIIVEDIVDTGLTLNYLMRLLKARGPRGIRVAALLSKPSRRLIDVHVDYLGFEIEDCFVVGYGLDHNQKFRNLRDIRVYDGR
jgi:hypoxanthine phosphoribosyltransferase